jgi:hypothetical protein
MSAYDEVPLCAECIASGPPTSQSWSLRPLMFLPNGGCFSVPRYFDVYLKVGPDSSVDPVPPLSTSMDPHRAPAPDATEFYLMHKLGSGREGEVYLARTEDGAICAIKIPFKDASYGPHIRRAIERECNGWHQLWGCHQVRVQMLQRRPCLIMPLVRMAETQDWESRDIIAATVAAARTVARHGYIYHSAARKHVGFYQGPNNKIAAVFVDLSSLMRRPADMTEDHAAFFMLERILSCP